MAPTLVPEDVLGVTDEVDADDGLDEVRAVVVVELVSVLTGACEDGLKSRQARDARIDEIVEQNQHVVH